jgi:hypothetical protein
MRRHWAQRTTLVIAALVFTAGCSDVPVQCGPCPSSGSFYIEAGRQPAGTTVRLCMEGHGCTDQTFPRESDTSNTVRISENITLDSLYGVDHETLDGATLTATLTTPDDRTPSQTLTTTVGYVDGGDGECACSYLGAEDIHFTPAR